MEAARAILAGDLSGLTAAGLAAADGLLRQPEVRQVQAHTLTDNMLSRRVLEKAGFRCLGLDEGEALYQRT
jgi:RimJ/RimL family protein N-acetyltransferase